MYIFLIVLSAIIGYLLGSINSSLVVGKFYKVDVREHGSGNAGATNTLRTLGRVPALIVSIGDILKGVISCTVGFYLAGTDGLMAAGLAAVIGHDWPLYFRFKGGKGALTSLVVVFFMDWRIGFAVIAVFMIITAISRYVSLGSMIGAFSFPIFALILNKDALFIVFAAILGFIAIIRHHSNIGRLIKGTESKIKIGI
jgi:acyl phosphate:glycerol-3-phosphate acyltransferase